MCGQKRKVSKDWDMEEDDGFGLWVWDLVEVIDVAVWAETTDDGDCGCKRRSGSPHRGPEGGRGF